MLQADAVTQTTLFVSCFFTVSQALDQHVSTVLVFVRQQSNDLEALVVFSKLHLSLSMLIHAAMHTSLSFCKRASKHSLADRPSVWERRQTPRLIDALETPRPRNAAEKPSSQGRLSHMVLLETSSQEGAVSEML